MLRINKGCPWLMWPNMIVENFIDFPANKIFEYDGNFSLKFDFELNGNITKKSTLFCKLPIYFGIDIEPNGLLMIVTYNEKSSDYFFSNYTWETNKRYTLEIKKNDRNISLTLNDEILISNVLKEEWVKDDLSHLIFGAGNFPKNGFNLNYIDMTLYYFEIKKEDEIISEHHFEEFIHEKSVDLTGNCNFLNKI